MASAATRGVAQGGLNPHPNPSGDGGPRLRSSPAKGTKPAALADITNTGRPSATRSIGIPNVVKENAKLLHLVTEKTKTIELCRAELQKFHLMLQASRRQNQQLVQTNSQMLAELNMGKDRIKVLQHELACATALLKVKDTEARQKNKADPSHDATKKRGRNQLKSGSSECVKDNNIMQDSCKSHLKPIMPLGHEDLRKPQQRRSSRLNQGSCEISGEPHKAWHADTVAPFAPSSLSVQKQHDPTTGKDMGKSLQNKRNAIVHEVAMGSEFKEIEKNGQPQQEVNLKEIHEAWPGVAAVEAHKTGDKACNTKPNHLVESRSSVPFDITEPAKPPEDNGMKRGSKKQKLASCVSANNSTIDDVNAKYETITGDPLCHKKKRKSARLNSISSEETNIIFEALHEDVIAPEDHGIKRGSNKQKLALSVSANNSAVEDENARYETTTSDPLCHEKKRKSARLNSITSEDTNSTLEALQEDVIAPLATSSSNDTAEQRTNQKQSDACFSMKSTEGQVAGRRSLRRASEKIISYKEIPLNVKMRRP